MSSTILTLLVSASTQLTSKQQWLDVIAAPALGNAKSWQFEFPPCQTHMSQFLVTCLTWYVL